MNILLLFKLQCFCSHPPDVTLCTVLSYLWIGLNLDSFITPPHLCWFQRAGKQLFHVWVCHCTSHQYSHFLIWTYGANRHLWCVILLFSKALFLKTEKEAGIWFSLSYQFSLLLKRSAAAEALEATIFLSVAVRCTTNISPGGMAAFSGPTSVGPELYLPENRKVFGKVMLNTRSSSSVLCTLSYEIFNE